MPTTESVQDDCGKDSEPSLAQLLKTEANASRQQHFDSGGGGPQMNGGGDSWGSISKMLHQRYNTGGAGSAETSGERFGDTGFRRGWLN